MRRLQLTLCAALLLACLSWGAAAAESMGLFSPDREAASPRTATRDLRVEAPAFGDGRRRGAPAPHGKALPELPASGELRSRVAEIDFGQLQSAQRSVEERRPHQLNLNLFADAQFEAVFERTEPTASGYALTGRIKGEPLSMVVLAVNGEWVAGTVWSRRGRYAIRPLGGGVAEVRRLGPSSLGRCEVGAESADEPTGRPPSEAGQPSDAALSKSASMSEDFPEDDGSVIDVLVVYLSVARRSAGGHLAMRALIDGDVAMANEAYRASGVVQRINLVGAVELPRQPWEGADRSMPNFLDRLVDSSDGSMDEAHALRDAYAADLVLAHWGYLTGVGGGLTIGSVSGIAFQMEDLSGDYERLAFSAASSHSFAHELGHGMGLRHERANDPANTPFPYSHGYLGEEPVPGHPHGVHTIMTSTGGEAWDIPRFSNPNLRYPDESGVVIGVPGDAPSDSADGPADAVRSLNGTRRVVANFRRSASRCSYGLSVPQGELPASGGEFRIEVEAGLGCAWSAWSNDDFVSVAEGAGGVGDGEVVFRVSANGGWERDVSVFVAGEAYLAEQATARERRAPTPVCERIPPIRDAITAAAGREACGEVTAPDLASIRVLNLRSWLSKRWGGSLPLGSFDGLTGLVSLDLSRNDDGLTALEPGLFDGLTKLTELQLWDNGLTALRTGAFDGVPNLTHLELTDNPKLATLEPGAFRGLSNIRELYLNGTGLTELSAGAFEGLSNLQLLIFGATFLNLGCDPNRVCFGVLVPLARIEPGAFRGMPNLHTLVLVSKSLAELQPDPFNDLPNLRILYINAAGGAGLTELPPGLFNGLPNLRELGLRENSSLTTLEPGVFSGLDALESLIFWDSGLQRLEAGVFDGLSALGSLGFEGNELHTLEPGVFDGLSRLWWLRLTDNKLATVHRDLFRGLDSLRQVELDGNQLTALHPGLFRGLGSLWFVDLSRNRLRTVPPNLFDDQRSRMDTIKLGGNRLTNIDPSLLRGMAGMNSLQLSDNGLAALPPSMFNGLYGLLRMDLSGNPGAPFAFRPEFVRAEGSSNSGGAAEVALELPQGAAFDLRVGLAASGGSLSANEALIGVGQQRGEAVAVTPDGAGPVTVRMAKVSEVPGPRCERISYVRVASHCWKGVRTALGAPLVLFGLPDQTLAQESAVRFDLPSAFPDSAEGTTFAVELDDPTVAEAVVAGGLLTLAAVEGGVTPVTVTATDPDGLSAALTFTVTVEQAVNSYWGGWRSVLLKPSPSEEGEDS